MLVFLIVCAALLLFGSHKLYKLAQSGNGWGLAAAFVLTVFAVCAVVFVLMSAVLFFQVLALSVLALVALVLSVPARGFVVAGSVVTLAVFGWVATREQLQLSKLRDQHPFENLQERLAHERGGIAGVGAVSTMPKETVVRLDELEDRFAQGSQDVRASMRTLSLRKIHEASISDFVNSEGFGVGRGIRPGKAWLRDYPLLDIPLEQPSSEDPTSADDAALAFHTSELRLTESKEQWRFREMHGEATIDFVNQQGFGYSQGARRVAGFQSHGFRHEAFGVGSTPDEADKWKVTRLELVSLLKHERPMAYVSEFLPRMDELQDAPVRELDDFEARALAALREGEDVVSAAATNRIRMLGSLRAARQCIQCHEVPRGTLLGAFSYDLRRIPPLPVQQPAKKIPPRGA